MLIEQQIEIIGAKAGESLVVSGAAGATGSMVVQIAKHIVGCSKVIGLAGTDEKCRWVEALGADKCINYKDSDWKEQLKVATEGFVDMYFDNVGGEQLDFMLRRMKREGRIAACGAVSDYNDDRHPYGIQNWLQIIIQRLAVRISCFLPSGSIGLFTDLKQGVACEKGQQLLTICHRSKASSSSTTCSPVERRRPFRL